MRKRGRISPLAAAPVRRYLASTGVFLGYDFITVTKDSAEWQHMKPAILGVDHGTLHVRPAGRGERRHWQRPKPSTKRASSSTKATPTIVEVIKELLDTRVRPAVAQDGGDITFKGFKDGYRVSST
jgi:hypothetical protein